MLHVACHSLLSFNSYCNQTQMALFSMVMIVTSLVFLINTNTVESVSFNFDNFMPNLTIIKLEGDAFVSDEVLQLTKSRIDGPITKSVGRASFDQPVKLWDKGTRQLTDFTTHFSFIMKAIDPNMFGDGLSFFIAPFESTIPSNSTGGFLGLFSQESAFNTTANQIVAVEFDSFENTWDPSSDHVGINVNSIISVANVSWNRNMKNGSVANAWVSYNSTTKNLSVFLTYADNPKFNGNSSLSHVIDLREFLPEFVRIGFSAATGDWIEMHNVLSWSFNSTLAINPNNKTPN